MRIITRIAKNELRHLFYSPVAWFLAIVMLVMCATFYTNLMYIISKMEALNARLNPSALLEAVQSNTLVIYNGPIGLFIKILNQLYLFVPLLTMAVISREFNNGTIKLLYSSPIKLRQIVLGKYLGMMAFCFILVLIAAVFVIAGFFNIQALDVPPLLSGLLALYLLLCALTAIGFFMSSLTNYQIISAIASFTVLFILAKIGSLWQQYEFVRDLTWFLSISGRTETMINGLITSKDIMYFLLIIFMFIAFTYLKLNDALERRPWFIRTARYLSIVLISLTAGYLSSRPVTTAYLDTTAQQINSAHPNTQQIMRALNEGPLEVTMYSNILERNSGSAMYGLPNRRNYYLGGYWEFYQRFKPDIHFKYEYYYAQKPGDSMLYRMFPGKSIDQIAFLIAKMAGIDSTLLKSPEQMPNKTELEAENYSLYIKLKYQDRTSILRPSFTNTNWPNQQTVDAAMCRLLNVPIPKVYFLTGQLERSIYKKGEREFFKHTVSKENRESLINLGFDADSLNLSESDIPASTTILVVADPRMEFPDTVLAKLQQYMRSGGNMLIMGEPGKQHVLNPLLRETGVQLMDGQLVQVNRNATPEKITGELEREATDLSDEEAFRYHKYLLSVGVDKGKINYAAAGATSLSVAGGEGFEIKPIVSTQAGKSWLKAGKLVTDSSVPVFNAPEGDRKENNFPVAVQLTRMINGKEQRIIVSGDADGMSALREFPALARGCYSYASYNKFPVYTPVPVAKDNRYRITVAGANAQKTIFIWIVPALLLIAGTVILVRRKRK
ncbi:MAG: Gldg family protein [Pseudobacter sp.]|uniref:Gldg family protein n=1 Tax=Pseudobacter sp. TaxID=2045420 RepID=UPI003F812EDC